MVAELILGLFLHNRVLLAQQLCRSRRLSVLADFVVFIVHERRIRYWKIRYGIFALTRRLSHDTAVVVDDEMGADLTDELRRHVCIETPFWDNQEIN